jgi:hypothetical protein
MTPIRNSTLNASSDLYINQVSNGVYPVRPRILIKIRRGAEV